MFEKEIQFITDFNLNKIKTLGSSFLIDKLSEIEMHPALLKYISGKMDYIIYEDRKALFENSRFDYSGAKISEYFNMISKEIKKTKKLSYDEVKSYIEKGIVFNANYTVQPKSTLTNLIFRNDEETKNTSVIKVYLNYIYYYDYLREIINSYISKRKTLDLSRDQFQSLIEKIDEKLLSARKREIISDALNSISDFYNDGGINKSLISPSLMEAFLKEKNLIEETSVLQKEFKKSKKKTEVDELKKILFAHLKKEEDEKNLKDLRIEEREKENEEKEIPNDEFVITEIEDNKEKELEEIIEIDKEEKDQDSIIEEEIIDEGGEEVKVSKTKEPIKDNHSKKHKKEKDIFSFVNKKEIEKIISLIFNDDEDDFANTMEKISDCSDYEQASEILKSIFVTYRINPYKKEAVTLTNAVSNYFHQDK